MKEAFGSAASGEVHDGSSGGATISSCKNRPSQYALKPKNEGNIINMNSLYQDKGGYPHKAEDDKTYVFREMSITESLKKGSPNL